MAKVVTLDKIQKGIELRNTGVTIRVTDNEECCGFLRIGKRVRWKPFGKGYKERERSWEDLIKFFMEE